MNPKYKEIVDIFRRTKGNLKQRVQTTAQGRVHVPTVLFCLLVQQRDDPSRCLSQENIELCRRHIQNNYLKGRNACDLFVRTVAADLGLGNISVVGLLMDSGLELGDYVHGQVKSELERIVGKREAMTNRCDQLRKTFLQGIMAQLAAHGPINKILYSGSMDDALPYETWRAKNRSIVYLDVEAAKPVLLSLKKKFPEDNLQIKVGSALELPYEKEFDCIYERAMFEGVVSDRLYLNYHRALKDGGFLLIENPISTQKAKAAASRYFKFVDIPRRPNNILSAWKKTKDEYNRWWTSVDFTADNEELEVLLAIKKS